MNRPVGRPTSKLVILLGLVLALLLAIGLAQYELVSRFVLSLLNKLIEGK